MSNKLQLVTTCVDCKGSDVDELFVMMEKARDITYATFARHVDIGAIAGRLGYAYRAGEKGVRLSRDWAVSFHRSTWKGKACYYLKWSAIEHIFQ